MDFEPCFKVYNLVSIRPKGMKLGQMTNLNVIFHMVYALKAPKAERFFCSSVFLEAGHSGKMWKTKMDTNAGVAGRRKELKEMAAEQLCMDNISTGLNESNDSSILDSAESLSTSLLLLSSFRIFTELSFSLTSNCSRLIECFHVTSSNS